MSMKTQIVRVMTTCELLIFTDVLAHLAPSIIIAQVVQTLQALTTLMTT